jgi:hypothetical protein
MADKEFVMHAPGPWSIDENDKYRTFCRIRDDRRKLVALIYVRTTARLIVAAPALLAACQEVLCLADNKFGHSAVDASFPLLRAAIAAAVPPTESPTCTGMFPEEQQ